MGLFRRRRLYDRARLLSEASRAQRDGKPRKAIARYREILEADPADLDVHRRIAPLLARTKAPDEAWASYRRAAEGLAKDGFVERAIGVYREAARHLPSEEGVWLGLAELELARNRRADAVEALWAGRRVLRSRRERPRAIRLLERAHEIEPGSFETSLELAGLLAKSGSRKRARALLAELAARSTGPALRRVRARELRLSPGLGTSWRWLEALGGSAGAGRRR